MDAVTRAAAVMEYVESRRDFAVDLLRRMTECESPSTDPDAQVEIRELICAELERLGMRCRRLRGRTSGGMLFAAPARRERGRPAQLILGHYDTVWPIGTLENMPFKVEGERISGPGVYDMRGGIVQSILALESLARLDRDEEAACWFLKAAEAGHVPAQLELARLMTAKAAWAHDHEVDAAEDARGALDLVRDNLYDVAILDFALPDMKMFTSHSRRCSIAVLPSGTTSLG
mgnify:CR=1 FL=1